MLRTLVSRFIVSRFIVTYSSFTIYSFTIYNRTISFYCTRCAAPHIPRARAPYTVCRYGDLIFITFFPSCFWSKAEQILFSIEF